MSELSSNATSVSGSLDRQLRVIEVDPSSDQRWDAFVTGQPSGIVYQHSGWISALEREYARKSLALVCVTGDGCVCGILPLMRTRGSRLLFKAGGADAGPRLASLPRTPVAGPLFTTPEAGAALIDAAVERLQAEPDLRLQLKPEHAELDALTDQVVGTPWRLTYVRTLPERDEQLCFGSSRNHARIKWAVNKASRSNVYVRPAESAEDLRAWYRLYLEAMRWHGVPPRPYRLFAAMKDHLQTGGFMTLLLAEQHEGGRTTLLAGSIFLKLGQTMFYAFNGCRLDAFSLRPNDLLLWRAMHDAWEEGLRRVDLGEVVEGDEGLATFKRKWGTTPTRLRRYYHPPLLSPRPEQSPRGGLALRAKAAWRRVPLGATELAGDLVYRYL